MNIKIAKQFSLIALTFVIPSIGFTQNLNYVDFPKTSDSVAIDPLPELGLWMIDTRGNIAHWLGLTLRGRAIREPVNIIIIDGVSKTEKEALNRLLKATETSEFEPRTGHSAGYSAYIGGILFPQIPKDRWVAFSDGPFELNNNHGRIFGPFRWGSEFIFTGAFSRENVNLIMKVKHQYSSFNQARDAFARVLDSRGAYRITAFVPLGNAIVDSALFTTGDHDGVAVQLTAK